ncbi:polycystic kidney disease protein 1-like 1 isoform X2 [Patiria miniata]|uniref:Receptor for egg jelly 7 n=1 Tax=Patiria miniata TaxID=46514 RepID=A0A913YX63_PATMI|nr:polycystic kidney disease protein 1-like 1 isoform X2 [Patiria miniata]
MKCLETKVTPVLLLGIQVVFLAQFVAGSSWYLGCTHDNASSEASESLLQDLKGNSVFTPASCASSCRERGSLYAGIHEQGANCTCSSIIGERIAEKQCNITCGNVSLPCGGDGVVSVYSVDGPYLLTAELSQTQHLVQEGATVRFEARVALATDELADLGLEGFSASDFDEIVFRWRVDGELLGETSLRYGNSTAASSFVHTFHSEGRWHIDVDVSNAISDLLRTTSIVVVRPLPSDLQVILRPTEGDAPSCVPMSSSATASLPAVSVFMGEEVEFQASVAMGVNLTFVWTFNGDGLNLTEVSAEEPDCEGIACMQDIQVHTFTVEGMYDVVVNVSNVLGSVRKTLRVVVVSHEISNLTMSLSSNSAFINKVNSSLGLLITMATTARQQVVLQVDFGDGSVFNHSMYDVNDTFITVGGEDSAHLHLTASYGEGCTLFVSLSHQYRHAGVFAVEANIFQSWDSQSAGTAKLESAIIVQEELGPIQIETQGVYSTQSLANFSLMMPVETANMSYLWSVTSNNVTVDLACYLEPTCLHNFTQPGQYLLKVSVVNLVSTAHAQEDISIQEAIRGLSLIGGSSGILPTGATIPFTASTEAGSDTQFTWHFSDLLGITEQRDYLLDALPTSQANHTFYTSGVYNVSVTARNKVSSETVYLLQGVQVQDPVLGLSLVSTGPTILGHPTHVNVTLLQGTHVTFSVHTEFGHVMPNVQHFGGDNTYILELAISNPGVFHATVVASNNISSDNATLCVVVQEPVGRVSIQEFYPGNERIVLLARLDGEIPNRTDVMYTWQARGQNLTSASPLLTFPVCLQPEQVVIQASNQVDVSQEERTVDTTIPQTKYSLDCPTFGEAGEPFTFSLQLSGDGDLAPVQVLIDHGDSAPNVTHTAVPGLPVVWNHTFPHLGVYPLHLWYHREGEDVFGETVMVVQKRIDGIQMIGPELSKFFGPVTTQTWEVTPTSGTDILYTWTVVPIITDYSHGTETSAEVNMATVMLAGSHGKVSMPFHAPGCYNLTLHASNLISSATHHSQTTLQQPIVQATVLVDPALIGTPSTYQLVVRGGPPFHFQIDFGMDGDLLSTTSEELASLGYEVIDYLLDPPACIYTFNQTYPGLGWYDSSFRVRNLVSEETATATAKVEEWITGLTLTSQSDSLVTIGRSVVLEAKVETGNDVVFTWDFQDPRSDPTLLYCFNASIATHRFSQPGTYQVSVSAGNSLQPVPLRVTYQTPFLVQEAPFALELNPPAGHPQGAALNHQGGLWATEVLSFRAQCWGSHLVFYFDYGDGTVETVVGMLDDYGSYHASGSHQYFAEGNYTVKVTAGNQLSNETRHLPRPYYVQVPPTSLRCESPYSAHAFGNVSRLTVRVETGTHLFYNWSMGDQTDYIDVGPSVSHLYRSPGSYTVTVVAFNKVQKAQATCRISVEVQVQGVQLLMDQRLHQTYTLITLEARTVTDSALWYHWDMGDQRDVQITSVNTLTSLYTFHGRYYVTVLAANHVSNATSLPVELTLQTAIQQVSIHAQSAALVNQSVHFEAWFKGSDTNFVWDFGDGTEKIYTTAESVYHKYNRTGEFFLHLEVSNLVSNATAVSKIFILTRMCHPPVLDIVGSDPRTVKHSEDIRVEAEVAIDCDITNLALYSWSITCSQNGTEVSLLQDRASLNQRTLYIPRWDLPYGSYTFTLDVVMNGTIVYAQDSIQLDVVRSPLMSIIEGGTRRYFGPDMVATLNGSFSYDPDDRNSNNDLRYNWTCHPLGLTTASCFNATALSVANQTSILPSSNESLVFPTSWLLPNDSRSFVFTLRVSKEGRADAEVTQVLTLVQEVVGAEGRQMQVSIDCLKCDDGIINANEQLTLEAVCPECDENTTYTWELYVVLDGITSSSFYDLTSGLRCVPGDGSYGQYLVANESSPSSPSSPSSNPEEDSNIINQGIQTIGTSTPQNGVSNAINTGLLPSDGVEEGSAPDPSGGDSGGTASTAATVTTGSDLGFGSLTEETGLSFIEEVSADEEVPATQETSGTPAAITTHAVIWGNSSVGPTGADHLNGNSSEPAGGSLNEAVGSLGEAVGSFQEAGSSFEEAVGSVDETGGSLEEAGGSFQEAVGSLAEASDSLQEAGGSFEEGAGSFVEVGGSIEDSNGTLAPVEGGLTTASGSLAEAGGSLDEAGGSLDEAGGSLVEGGGSLTEGGGSLAEAGGSFVEADGSLAEGGGSLTEGAGSFQGDIGTTVETEGSLMESNGSLAEAGGSLAEAGGSFGTGGSILETGSLTEGDGSLTEAGGSFDEAGGSLGEAAGSSLAEELPGSAGSNNGTVAPTAEGSQMGGSLAEGTSDNQQASIPGQDYPEAVDSIVEDTVPVTGQGNQTVSQPGDTDDFPDDDYYDGNYPEEYLGYSDPPEQHPPPLPDPNTGDDTNGGDPVVNPDVEPTVKEHIVSKSLQQRVLRPEDTTTGLGSRALTIKPGLLDENRTYALVVSTHKKENGVMRIGEAQQYVSVNRGPRAGLCSITPDEGNEMDTVFTINCLGWQDEDSPIQYEVSYSLNETEDLTILYLGMKHAVKFQLPAGYIDNDHLVYVKVAIVDGQGGKTSVCSITIQVLPKMFSSGESVEEFLYNLTLADSNLLTMYVQQGDQHNLNGFINMVACILNRQPALGPGSSDYLLSLRRQIRYALVSAVLELPMRDQFEVQQSSMATAASSYVPLELQVDTVILAAYSVNSSMASAVASARLLSQLDVDILVALTSTTSSVVSALAMNHTQAIGVGQRKVAVRSSLGAVMELLQTYLQLQKPDEEPVLIQTSSVDLLGARQTSLATVDLTVGTNAFLLPNGMEQVLHAQNGGGVIGTYMCHDMAVPCWDVDMVTFKDNPYLWGEGAYKVTTDVSSLTLHSCTGQELKVENLTAGKEVVFEVAHTCDSLGDSLMCNLTIDKANMNVHEFVVLQENIGQTFQIMARLAPETRRTFPVKLIMRYGAQPTPTAYDSSWMYENEDEDLVIFLPPNTFNATGTYYIALINAEYGESSYGQDEVSQRQYLIRLWWGECLYWNTENEAWVGDGCSVMHSSTYELTRCRCNHLTTFGVTFLPISIILDIVSLAVFDTPNTNPITYSFTAGILSIYILLYIYCYLADKHDERKLGLIYLADNQPADQQYYEITVETGMRAGAGTTARVSMVLHGVEGHSETKELICKGRPIFEKNSRDRFIVSVPESLGSIRRVHVWHNNAGHSPSWFLSRVAVRDLITGHKWYFICERWFAVEEDDGKIERDLEVLDKGVGFQKAFFAKLFQYFADYYLWSSIFTRPPYSVFTRVQRLTCSLSISMGFLCINTIWYQHLVKEEVDLGLIDVSAENMLVGIVTAILAIPVNFPVIMVFRRTRPRRDEIEEEKNFRSVKATIELPESAAPVETILNQGSLDSGVGEQSDVTLDDLPGWVQEKWRQRLKGSSSRSDQTRSSYDSISFTSSSSLAFDDPPTSSSLSNATKPSDSGVSSPDSRSLLSSYLPTAAAGWQADHKRLANPKIWLPNWCGKLAWAICGFITVFSAVVTIYYGYRFSDVKSVYWMQSVYFSFLQCIFVTQPAVMLMFTILKSVRHRNNIHIFDHYDDNIDLIDKKSLERARLEVYETDMNKAIAARQRSRYLRFARPPQPKELQKAKEKMLKEKNMWAILKDVIMYSTLFACLMWMAYGREVAYHLPVNQGVRQTYLQTPHPFTEVSSVDDLWSWMHGDLLDRLYWDEWYNKDTVVEEKNSIMNGESILLGKASLRQVRVRHHSCPVARPAQSLFPDCKASYGPSAESTVPYGPEDAWAHYSKGELRRYSKWGYFGSYEGDGYVVSLNSSREGTRNQLAFLQNNSWIDDQTRAVIVEFTIYNAPTNLYTSVAFLAELPGTGAVHPFPKIESVLLYRYETVYDYLIMCCELLFLLLVAVSCKREVQKLVKIRAAFFKSTWSWMEMGMIILSLTYFAMYVCRFMYVNSATQHLRETYLEEFVDFSLLAYWDQILKDLLASLIFLSSVKFLRVLRFNQTVALFGAVIDEAIKEILTFALYLLVLEMAFACLGVLLFSTHFYPLKHLYISSTLLNSMVMGRPLDYGDLAAEFPILWYLFYFAYVFSMIIFMAGLIKAILCHSYRQVKQRQVPAVGGMEVLHFFWNKFLIRVGLKEAPEEDKPMTLPTEFTMAEIEYQVDELLFRMSAITHQHGLPEKTYGYFEDSDGTHNMMEDGMSSTCSELNFVDSTHLEDGAQKMEAQLYGHNPELADGNCFADEDREKQLRSGLDMEIYKQLRHRRLQHDLHDSGHDTQSTSEHMEFGSDVASMDQPLPSTPKPLNVRDAQGRPTFPKPLQNLGILETVPAPVRPPSAIFTNRKQAWGQSSSAEAKSDSQGCVMTQRPPRVATPQDRCPDRPPSTSDVTRRPYTAGVVDKRSRPEHRLKPTSASFARRDRQLVSSSEVLDTQSSSSSSSFVHRTDSMSSHASDLGMSQVNAALGASHRIRDGIAIPLEPVINLDQLVRDYPEGERPTVERAFSVESFPLPNALDGLSSSSDENTKDTKSAKRKHKGSRESEARHRLRKTRSRGKGKGRRRFDEAIYVNDAFSSDSGGDIPVIQMGPTMHHERR